MEKKRQNMLLYVTATSVVGLGCNDSSHAVGDVAQSPDFRVGKIAMVVPDASPAPITEDASPPAQPPVPEAITDAGASRDAAAAARPQPPRPRPPGKIAAPPDR